MPDDGVVDLRFRDHVVVVTGAASEIGEAVAARLAAEGATVVGVDRLDHTVGAHPVVADLTDEDAVTGLYDEVVSTHGRLDVVYNNVGLMDPDDGALPGLATTTWHRVLEANLTTTMLSCKHAVPHLLATEPRGGAIVNAASFLADTGAATAPMAFSAAKAAVVQLTRDLAVHLARSDVRVNAVLFGPVATAAQQGILERSPEILPARLVHWPMGRYGTLEEAAGAVAWLASADAGFVTGHALPLDGGITRAFTVPD